MNGLSGCGATIGPASTPGFVSLPPPTSGRGPTSTSTSAPLVSSTDPSLAAFESPLLHETAHGRKSIARRRRFIEASKETPRSAQSTCHERSAAIVVRTAKRLGDGASPDGGRAPQAAGSPRRPHF